MVDGYLGDMFLCRRLWNFRPSSGQPSSGDCDGPLGMRFHTAQKKGPFVVAVVAFWHFAWSRTCRLLLLPPLLLLLLLLPRFARTRDPLSRRHRLGRWPPKRGSLGCLSQWDRPDMALALPRQWDKVQGYIHAGIKVQL